MNERQAAYFKIQHTFGTNNMVALVVPSGNYDAEAKILEELDKNKENYSKISDLSNERGFSKDEGLYAKFKQNSEELTESFNTLLDKNSWLEIKWMEGKLDVTGEPVQVAGKNFRKVKYKGEFPTAAKRDYLAFRVGETLTYNKEHKVH